MRVFNHYLLEFDTGVLKQYGLEAEVRRIMSISTDDERETKAALSSMTVPVWEAFTLSFNVEWPVSIVLSHRALTCYQMLFRHFFHLKRVARVLCRARCGPRSHGSRPNKSEVVLTRNVHALKFKMVHFVQTLEHGMFYDVIGPAWHVFVSNVATVRLIHILFFFVLDRSFPDMQFLPQIFF